MGQYTYRVLRQIDPSEVIADDTVIFIDCGEHDGKTPDVAALAAAEKSGKQGDYRAISLRHFNDVPIVPTSGLMVGTREKAAKPETAALDPEHPCEWSEDGATCGHLPSVHTTDGIGMCTVSGCPCGHYEPAP